MYPPDNPYHLLGQRKPGEKTFAFMSTSRQSNLLLVGYPSHVPCTALQEAGITPRIMTFTKHACKWCLAHLIWKHLWSPVKERAQLRTLTVNQQTDCKQHLRFYLQSSSRSQWRCEVWAAEAAQVWTESKKPALKWKWGAKRVLRPREGIWDLEGYYGGITPWKHSHWVLNRDREEVNSWKRSDIKPSCII